MQARGHRFESDILHNSAQCGKRFFDILKVDIKLIKRNHRGIRVRIKKVNKGVRGMPWLSEAMKDVTSCDKLRGGAITFDPEISEWGNPSC